MSSEGRGFQAAVHCDEALGVKLKGLLAGKRALTGSLSTGDAGHKIVRDALFRSTVHAQDLVGHMSSPVVVGTIVTLRRRESTIPSPSDRGDAR